jgi:hypothetical protein
VDASIQFKEQAADPWNEELEQSREILRNFSGNPAGDRPGRAYCVAKGYCKT